MWVAVSHGDVIKAILADALGMHLDAFQRIVVDPASLSVVRYTPHRAFVRHHELVLRVASAHLQATAPQAQPAQALRGRRRRWRRRSLGGDHFGHI